MTLAASEAAGCFLNASDCGVNGSSRLGNGSLLSAQAFSSSAMELAIKLDNVTRVESIGSFFVLSMQLTGNCPWAFMHYALFSE